MENLQPKDSLAIIEAVINQRKQKYEQNGIIFIFWGVMIVVSGIVNFVTKNPLVWAILMPLMGVVTGVYFFIKGKNNAKKRKISDWTTFIWLAAGICAMLTGFTMPYQWINFFVFVPFIFASLSTALQLKNKLWMMTSLISMLLVYVEIYVEIGWYSTLLASLLGALVFLIPGVQFYINYKKTR